MEFSITFDQSQGKHYLVNILFSLTIGMVVRKVVALIAVGRCELYHLAL